MELILKRVWAVMSPQNALKAPYECYDADGNYLGVVYYNPITEEVEGDCIDPARKYKVTVK